MAGQLPPGHPELFSAMVFTPGIHRSDEYEIHDFLVLMPCK